VRRRLTPLLLLLLAAPALAGEPYLVKDISPAFESGGSRPEDFHSLGNTAMFWARTAETGRELWGSDGTAAGTFLLHEACAGHCSGSPPPFSTPTPAGHFFLGQGGLWITRGTPASTFRLAESLILPGRQDHRRRVWTDAQGLLYFAAGDGVHGMELWRSDGTAAGTFLVADIRPGPEGSDPQELTVFNGRVFFRADDGASGPALWQSDGTPAGTRLVKDTWPAHPPHPQRPALLQAAGRFLFFTAPSPGAGVELWKSDGTARGTAQVADLSPRASTSFRDAVAFGSRLLFVAVIGNQGQELWITDGTASGTRRLTSFPGQAPFLGGRLRPRVPLGSRFVFEANDGRSGNELWVTDGTAAGTRLVRDSCPGSCSGVLANGRIPPLVHQGRLFFSGTEGQRGFEPWVSDGTPGGTRLLRDVCRGRCDSFPFLPTPLGSRVLFVALTGEEAQDGQEIWRTDGTAAGTVRITSFGPSHPFEDDSSTAVVSGAVLFSGADTTFGTELWRTDGTRQGTRLVADIERGNNAGSFPHGFMTAGETLYFFALEGGPAWSLWKSDGTEAGTSRVGGTFPEGRPRVHAAAAPAVAGGPFFFVASFLEGLSLYRSDGTGDGTFRLDLDGARPSFNPLKLQAAGGKVFFVAEDDLHGRELWVSDGTPAGTRLVKDLTPGELGSDPRDLAAFGGRLFFSAYSPDGTTRHLWVSDGTPAGTVVVNDAVRYPTDLAAHRGLLYFFAQAEDFGEELWRTDGTAAGTVRVVDPAPGPQQVGGFDLLSNGSVLFFWNGVRETEPGLWVSDGTAAGTRRISTVLLSASAPEPVVLDGVLYFSGSSDYPDSLWRSDGTEAGTYLLRGRGGVLAYFPRVLAVAGGRLVFISFQSFPLLWQSDGTPEGTFPIREISYPPGGLMELGVAGSRVFFSAREPATGHELWALAPE
jgi:ELWxxDGT repeat protein